MEAEVSSRSHNCPSPVPIQSQLDPVHTHTPSTQTYTYLIQLQCTLYSHFKTLIERDDFVLCFTQHPSCSSGVSEGETRRNVVLDGLVSIFEMNIFKLAITGVTNAVKLFFIYVHSSAAMLAEGKPLLTFRRRIKSRLPFAGIIRRLSYSTRFQDKV